MYVQTQHACPLHRRGHKVGFVHLFQFLRAHQLFHLCCLCPPCYERIPKRNTRKGTRFSLSLSFREFSLPGRMGRAVQLSSWWPGNHQGGRERQRHRKIGRQRQKVGKRGRKRKGDGREKTGLVAWYSLEYALSYYFLQQDPNSQRFQK